MGEISESERGATALMAADGLATACSDRTVFTGREGCWPTRWCGTFRIESAARPRWQRHVRIAGGVHVVVRRQRTTRLSLRSSTISNHDGNRSGSHPTQRAASGVITGEARRHARFLHPRHLRKGRGGPVHRRGNCTGRRCVRRCVWRRPIPRTRSSTIAGPTKAGR